MTPIRKLAIAISETTIRWSSPGCKDWAAGLARELAAIPSDWAALRWSFGSLSVLLDRREAPIQSLNEVPYAAQRLARTGRGSTVVIWNSLIWAVISWSKVPHAAQSLQRIGEWFVVCGWLCMGLVAWFDWRKDGNHVEKPIGNWTLFSDANVGAWTSFYKAELGNRLRRLQSLGFWGGVFAMLSVCAGLIIASQNHLLTATVWLSLWGVLTIILLSKRNKMRRRLHQLDELLAEQEARPV